MLLQDRSGCRKGKLPSVLHMSYRSSCAVQYFSRNLYTMNCSATNLRTSFYLAVLGEEPQLQVKTRKRSGKVYVCS